MYFVWYKSKQYVIKSQKKKRKCTYMFKSFLNEKAFISLSNLFLNILFIFMALCQYHHVSFRWYFLVPCIVFGQHKLCPEFCSRCMLVFPEISPQWTISLQDLLRKHPRHQHWLTAQLMAHQQASSSPAGPARLAAFGWFTYF